jgi:methionyl-tRNA formyltransferase
MKRIGLLGSVNSSRMILECLIDSGYSIALVGGVDEKTGENISGYQPIHRLAQENNIDWITFKNVNSKEVINMFREANLDVIIVIGLSQIISKDLISCAKEYCIGAHPTALPKYRGRAAIPWLILLGENTSKATLFKLSEDMDSGDIIEQMPYEIKNYDYANDVCNSADRALCKAFELALPKINNNTIRFIQQNHDEATYLLARSPEDGYIDWNDNAKDIQTLIRATSKPYPGAYSHYNKDKVIIWEASFSENEKYIGSNGQIADVDENGRIYVITGNGLLIVENHEMTSKTPIIKIGRRFK